MCVKELLSPVQSKLVENLNNKLNKKTLRKKTTTTS